MVMTKITGKQEITGGLDINSFVNGADPDPVPIPSNEVERLDQPEVRRAERLPKKQGSSKPKAKRGRPAKPSKELVNRKLQVLLTEAELKRVEEKAGLVAVSKFIRKHLQDTGLI